MPKNSRKKVSRCNQHEFSLRPRPDCPAQLQHFHASFCSQLSEGQVLPCLDCPTFNFDNNFATPTFVLTSDKVDMW